MCGRMSGTGLSCVLKDRFGLWRSRIVQGGTSEMSLSERIRYHVSDPLEGRSLGHVLEFVRWGIHDRFLDHVDDRVWVCVLEPIEDRVGRELQR